MTPNMAWGLGVGIVLLTISRDQLKSYSFGISATLVDRTVEGDSNALYE